MFMSIDKKIDEGTFDVRKNERVDPEKTSMP